MNEHKFFILYTLLAFLFIIIMMYITKDTKLEKCINKCVYHKLGDNCINKCFEYYDRKFD